MTTKTLSKLLSLVANAAKLTAKGEFMEMNLASKPTITEAEYLEVASLKTGSLFAATAASGALVGGASARVVEQMYNFGLSMGIAFQIKDDLLDVMGDSQSIGKPVFKDLQNNACNMVLVHALLKADTYQKNALMSLVYRKWFAPRDILRLQKTLESLGSAKYAEETAGQQLGACRNFLRALPSSRTREKLERLTYLLGSRTV
jgi:geranylgeranyl pyrophosphate synthase